MGKMLAFLTILRKNSNIIVIQICTLGPSSAVISELLRPHIFSCVEQTPVGFWRSALLKCGKLKDFQGAKPRSHPFLITCFLHTQFFSSSNITATSLIIFWVSQPRGMTVVPPAPSPTVPPRAPCVTPQLQSHHLNGAQKWIQHSWLDLRELSTTGSPGQMVAWLVSVQPAWF